MPTLFECGRFFEEHEWDRRAKEMLFWLVGIQLDEGGFQGGVVGYQPVVPVTFNTGQILMGLAAGSSLDPSIERSMHRAARWLVDSQDPDGCWRKHPTPFAAEGEKAYETHVAWGLLEAAKASGREEYADAGLRNVHWALTKQSTNGWFRDCCLTNSEAPLTHTLGYALRGVVEAYLFSREDRLLQAAMSTAAGLEGAIDQEGFLPGRLDQAWRPQARWACLTGTVQIAHCWILLYQETGDSALLEAARAATRYVRRTVDLDGPPETRGGVRGSFPISGDYGPYEYLNWAAKFFIDANLLEMDVTQRLSAT